MDADERERLRRQQSIEQGFASMVEHLPAVWRQMYLRLIEEGFTEDQALRIILAMATGVSGGKST